MQKIKNRETVQVPLLELKPVQNGAPATRNLLEPLRQPKQKHKYQGPLGPILPILFSLSQDLGPGPRPWVLVLGSPGGDPWDRSECSICWLFQNIR